MNILHVTSSYKPAYVYGGPTMSISKLCENVTRSFGRLTSSFRIEVLTTTANGLTELSVVQGKTTMVDLVTVTYFNRITKDHSHFSPRLLLCLWTKLNSGKTASRPIVHIHAWWNLVSVLSCIIALIKNCPVILSPRGTLSNYSFNNKKSFVKSLFHLAIGEHLLKRCHFHVTSAKEHDDIIRLVRPKSITVIPNFVDLPNEILETENKASFPRRNTESTKLQLLFLSRIEEKKGLDLLFKALSLLSIPWTLSIAGDGKPEYVKKLKSLASELQIDSHLQWMGHLKNKEKFAVLESHELLVLPSYDENFANVVIESIAMGTPVLISTTVGLADYVVQHKLGMVGSQDPLAIKDSLNDFFRQRHRFNNEHFKNRIKKDFNEPYLADQYIRLYESIR